MVALLDHLGIESCAFWGYSAGISVGLKLADDHPARIRALVGTGGVGPTSPEEFAEFVARQIQEHRERGWGKMLARFDEHERRRFRSG